MKRKAPTHKHSCFRVTISLPIVSYPCSISQSNKLIVSLRANFGGIKP